VSTTTTPVADADGIAQALDELGNPMVKVTGCPNCGAGACWMGPIEYFGKRNSGIDPDAPCSRACALQTAYAAELAAREPDDDGPESGEPHG
jgi:hypothetical protein